MHPNRTNFRPIQKTGELLIREGLARKEDVDAALKIQAQESDALSIRSGPPPLVEISRSEPPTTIIEADADHLPVCRERGRRPRTAKGRQPADPSDRFVGSQRRYERTIGRILCDLNLISPIDLSRVLKKYQKQLRLGEILLRDGVIDAKQLEDALYEQQLHLKPLGHILIRKNRINMDQLYAALSSQYNLPYRRLADFVMDAAKTDDLIRIIGKNYAEENHILPLSLDGTTLTLAVHEPEKMMSIHELRTVYSYLRMECVLIEPEKFYALFAELYGIGLKEKRTDVPEPDGMPPATANPGPEPAALPEPSVGQPDSDDSRFVTFLIKHAIHVDAASIHIDTDFEGVAVRCRINGVLKALNLPWLEDRLPRMIDGVVAALREMAGLKESDSPKPQNGAFHVRLAANENGEERDFYVRLAIFPSIDGEHVTLRISDTWGIPPRLEDLQLSFQVLAALKRDLGRSGGMLLFSGPPGSGIETIRRAAASYLAQPGTKVIAVEERFRSRLPGIVQFLSDPDRRLGTVALLRAASNHDPDVVLSENMGDPETAETLFDIASQGPLVLGGIMADDAVDTLMRLKSLGIRSERIARSVTAILSQRRVKKICNTCREPYIPEPDAWRGLFSQYPADISFYRGAGCSACRFTGYDGFLAVSEYLIIDSRLSASLEAGADADTLRQVAARSGFKPMGEDALLKLNRTTIEALLKTFPRLSKGPELSDTSAARGAKPIPFRRKTWTIASLAADSPVVDEMYETYRLLREPAGSRPVDQEIRLFSEFIDASFHHICRQYACSEVTFCIENRQGRPEITASPVLTVHQDR